jgi:peptidoglycan/LPS O-acetylase OafA/YrhL
MSLLTKPSRLGSLTFLRFLTASFVLLHHCLGIVPHFEIVKQIGRMGYLGVTVFFVLSGFVLFWSRNPAVGYVNFMIRRLSRIYPLHVIGTILCIWAFRRLGTPLAGAVGTPLGTGANFLLIHAWPFGYHPEVRQAWNGVSWTLSCEFAFYLVAPFVFTWIASFDPVRTLPRVLIAWVIVTASIAYAQSVNCQPFLIVMWWNPIGHMFDFFLGAYAAHLALNGKFKVTVSMALVGLLVPLGEYLAFVPFASQTDAMASYLLLPGIALLLIAFAEYEALAPISLFENPLLSALGDSSYALYVFHAIALGALGMSLGFLGNVKSPLEGECLTLAFFVVANLGALLIHYGIETPLRHAVLHLFRQSGRISNLRKTVS